MLYAINITSFLQLQESGISQVPEREHANEPDKLSWNCQEHWHAGRRHHTYPDADGNPQQEEGKARKGGENERDRSRDETKVWG